MARFDPIQDELVLILELIVPLVLVEQAWVFVDGSVLFFQLWLASQGVVVVLCVAAVDCYDELVLYVG